MRKIYVYRCLEGCDGIAGSWDRAKVIDTKAKHFDEMGHNGRITLEDEEVVIEIE